MTQAFDKTMVTRAVISKIEEEENPQIIKAKHVKGYDSPNKVSIKGNNEGYTPDIAVVYDNSTTVYEIELNKSVSVDKWEALSLYARKNNGNLYLVIPDYLKGPIKEKIAEKDINAGVIYFDTE